MITGALWVLGCQLVGEVVVRSLGIPVPGPVVGMVLLFGVLTVRRAGTGEDADGGPMAGTLCRSELPSVCSVRSRTFVSGRNKPRQVRI